MLQRLYWYSQLYIGANPGLVHVAAFICYYVRHRRTLLLFRQCELRSMLGGKLWNFFAKTISSVQISQDLQKGEAAGQIVTGLSRNEIKNLTNSSLHE